MSNKAIQLYRNFLRVLRNTTTPQVFSFAKEEIRYHYQGNSLRQCDTDRDIKVGYQILELLKKKEKV